MKVFSKIRADSEGTDVTIIMCTVHLLGTCYNVVKIFVLSHLRGDPGFLTTNLIFSPLSVISLHHPSVANKQGSVIGPLIFVSSTLSHLAEITVASFANPFPHTELLNLLSVKKA